MRAADWTRSPAAVIVRFIECLVAGNVDAVLTAFDDASKVEADQVYAGRAAIRGYFTRILADSPARKHVDYDVFAGPAGAVDLRWRMRLDEGGGIVASGTDHFVTEDGMIRVQVVVHDGPGHSADGRR